MFSGCQLAGDSDELDLETLRMLNRLGGNSTLSDRAAKLYELEVNPTGIALGWDGPVVTLRGEEMVVSHGIVGLGGAKDVDGITETIQLTAANRDRPAFLSVGLFGFEVGPAKVQAVVENLGSDFEVVRGDVFFKLAKQALRSGT